MTSLGKTLYILSFFLLAAVMLMSSCLSEKPKDNEPAEIIVAAAADLYSAFTEIGKMFENETGNKVVFSFGSTGNLTTQIEGGAPFDIFAAADVAYIERLKEMRLLINDSVQLYAQGRIVLAVNRNSGLKIENLSELLDPRIKHVAIANPVHAPYGLAAKQALQSLGVWEAIQPKLVYGENVRQTLIYIQRGEAEAGIVALSVASVPEISYLLIDDKIHKPLNQALGIISSTRKEKTAREFIGYVNTKGRPVMKKYGFLLPGEFTK